LSSKPGTRGERWQRSQGGDSATAGVLGLRGGGLPRFIAFTKAYLAWAMSASGVGFVWFLFVAYRMLTRLKQHPDASGYKPAL
jgi:hypothetical protein